MHHQGALAYALDEEEKGMSDQPRSRDEKNRDEKQEKDRGGWDEKWRRDPVDAAMWAVILIWAGIMLLAANIGWFARFERVPLWSIGFIGAGIIMLLAAFFRLLVPAYRRPLSGNLVFALILIGIGLGDVVGWLIIGPAVLIAIGLGILFTGLLRRR
jgi:hypothetical protein